MIRIRPGSERGHAVHGWLDTYHTFSFANYHDPRHMGFRGLRVINDDRIGPGGGFPMHPHRDMEIVSYVVEGALEHRDSMGNGSVIRPGDVQRMSAGTGVTHSEFNPSEDEGMRLLQIWIEPGQPGIEPSYEQQHFTDEDRRGGLRVVASPDGAAGSVTLHADARILAGLLGPGDTVTHEIEDGRGVWIQVVRGSVRVGDEVLSEGDGASVEQRTSVQIEGESEAEVLLFDLA
jgi:redox-sensitive bicupin YhaK (pirin superfamily)